ncbi:MAG: CBS domain-containing protein [gamma proteobacterium symbiont of Bathyaustriella thionipta]|nr:CBS domain-containing protein [gamma proteobacterium symbiont of Bathyaustriella thionipta]MCU7951761.1 CBS domain-containing protein [gamma proteobacterium symbiont of Bathyaustriella thionipta]MCU7958364.1 CBS domain-containing protein [gamma proteobacterium symbiont of Bathyaustriella thionipta]MCU7967701.1 CBS domain-containing protein [gamma proteobacterium symbiont of Bathyaustriella thionipta]
MLIWALIVNNLLPDRHYPNGIQELNKSQSDPVSADSEQFNQLNLIHRSDLHSALIEMDAFVDVSEDELTKIFNLSLMHSYKKNVGDILCRDIMTPVVTTVDYDTDVEQVWQLMIEKRVHAFPVVDKADHILGIVSLRDFLNQIKVKDNSSTSTH